MNMCWMDSTTIQTHNYFDPEWFQCCLHRFGSSTTQKTTKNQEPNPPVEPEEQKMSTLTPPKGTFHSFFFNKTLYKSYWEIYEWIWVLILVIWPIWKNGDISTWPPNEFNLDDAEVKLFSLMKSPHAADGCKLVWHRVDKGVTCIF